MCVRVCVCGGSNAKLLLARDPDMIYTCVSNVTLAMQTLEAPASCRGASHRGAGRLRRTDGTLATPWQQVFLQMPPEAGRDVVPPMAGTKHVAFSKGQCAAKGEHPASGM